MIRIAMLCLALLLVSSPTLGSGCGDLNRARYEPRTFLGYICEDDCRRHKAGFRWAEEHEVRDAQLCDSLDATESQGCRAYVDEPFDAEAAGERWAIENEIADPCLCNEAGERFRAGCLGGAVIPAASPP